MSGGVDSSVAVALLQERGFRVVGIHMRMWGPQGSSQLPAASYQHDAVCRQQYQDRRDAMAVAAHLDIPFQTWDFTAAYREAVVEYMIREYAAGRTPNPDVMCNRHIKFGLFLRKALATGADWVATGHYIRKSEIRNPPALGRARARPGKPETNSKSQISNSKLLIANDGNKDQSYFLWTLTQEQLRHCLFPIGDYTKPEVRAMARERGLSTAEKPDSQGICFIGEIDISEFLRRYIPERRGRVLTTAGSVVGEHGGAQFYTIGQRQGLGIGGGIPYYVAEKNLADNTLVVAEGPYDGALFKRELVAIDINWISGEEPELPFRCQARIRYRQPLQPCEVAELSATSYQLPAEYNKLEAGNRKPEAAKLKVMFNEPQRAVTPGQSIVFYKGQEMLGGAFIA